jgi:hypothetical protein
MDKDVLIFGNERIRRDWKDDDWFYSVVDVVGILSKSSFPKRYWSDLKTKLKEEGFGTYDKIVRLKLKAADGKMRETDCADLKNIFRIIQSIPSKRAEPFKVWLAEVGSERMDEMDDPELSIDRTMKNYLAKGYSEKWINQRLKTIEIRKELTDEWRRVGVEEGKEFAVLTNEITLAWSGKSIKDYKNLKSLKKENLRDNMTNLELALNTLAEATTTEISKEESPNSFLRNLDVAKRGGSVSGVAREKIEEELGRKIVSSKNSKDIIDIDTLRVDNKRKRKLELKNE